MLASIDTAYRKRACSISSMGIEWQTTDPWLRFSNTILHTAAGQLSE
jgi:hypothetical protein